MSYHDLISNMQSPEWYLRQASDSKVDVQIHKNLGEKMSKQWPCWSLCQRTMSRCDKECSYQGDVDSEHWYWTLVPNASSLAL